MTLFITHHLQEKEVGRFSLHLWCQHFLFTHPLESTGLTQTRNSVHATERLIKVEPEAVPDCVRDIEVPEARLFVVVDRHEVRSCLWH